MKTQKEVKAPARHNKTKTSRQTAKNVLRGRTPVQARPLEERLREAMKEGTGITVEATQGTYTESKDGVRPEFDIRTDKQMLAIEAIEKVNGYVANQQKTESPEVPGQGKN